MSCVCVSVLSVLLCKDVVRFYVTTEQTQITHHVYALGRDVGLLSFLIQDFCGPLLPMCM